MREQDKYYQSRRFRKLLKSYEDAVSEGITPYLEADELTDIAEFYMTDRQDEKASRAIQTALDMHPDSVDPQIFLARQHLFYGRLVKARSIVESIHEQDDSEVIYLRAELLIKEGKPLEASSLLEESERIMQDCLDTYLYDCTSIFMDYDQWQLAHEWSQRLRAVCPHHPSLPLMEAEIKMGLDDYESAEGELRQILDYDPYCTEAWNLLAETCVALEQYAEAIEAADYALAINPEDADAHLMKGNALLRDDKWQEAAQEFERYLTLQPEDVGASISLAICYNSCKRYPDALDMLIRLERSLGQHPVQKQDLAQVLMMQACTLSLMEKYSEALDVIEKAERWTPEDMLWQFYYAKAEILLQSRRLDEAENLFAQALSQCPEKEDTLFNIACTYSNAGESFTALTLFQDVWDLYGVDEGKFVMPFIAKCYQQMGDTKHFLQFLKHSAAINREATVRLFGDTFKGVQPEDYYAYAFRAAHGRFPSAEE